MEYSMFEYSMFTAKIMQYCRTRTAVAIVKTGDIPSKDLLKHVLVTASSMVSRPDMIGDIMVR